MKKIITIFILCLSFMMVSCKSNDEETINTLLNIELVEGKETVSQRIDTMAHMALFMQDKNEFILDEYVSQYASMDYFLTVLTNLSQHKIEMNEEIYNYLSGVLDIRGLSETSYFDPFEIMPSIYTKTELIDTKEKLGTVLRVTYDSPDEYLTMDIPYETLEVNKEDYIYIYPGQAIITTGRGRMGKTINMENQEQQLFYLLVNALEKIYYYEYEMGEAAANPA
ncbi:hypothetical protein HUW86_05215 [Fusobacterium sp. SB021]|uniref:hypothetical protein n=1 Tax=Fusobacterium sp. SB021 TaxID=2744227 RepID=UPI003CF91B9B